jgi:squalene synthase HpnC
MPGAFEYEAIVAKASAENFPVAVKFLPQKIRKHLLVTYAYARLIDDIGDLSSGDRLAHLDSAEAELRAAFSGSASTKVFADVAASAAVIGVPLQTYLALIEANRMDQSVTRYETITDLEGYCALSAQPIGRIVLAIFDVRDPRAEHYSDAICTGLQLVEHWQDVREDYAAGRVYLPQEDLRSFGVREEQLERDSATSEFRRLMAFEVTRAKHLIDRAKPLVSLMPALGRIAIAGFIGGGLAQIDAIERAKYDTLHAPVKASKASVLRHSAIVFAFHRGGAR